MNNRVPWLDMLKDSGCIRDYEVKGMSVKEGCPVMELAVLFNEVPDYINGTMTVTPEHTKLDLHGVMVIEPSASFLQQLDEDQGLT